MSSPKVAVVTDSTSDIPDHIAEALQIRIVPALVTVDDRTYIDGSGLSRSEFYARMPSLPRPALTAAPSPAAFEAVYDSALVSGAQQVISIHVSSRLSGIFNTASQAAKGFGERVMALDGGHVSMALGFQAIVAAEAALKGAAVNAVVRVAEEARRRARLIALIDTLEYLRRSGRVTWLRAGIGDLLRVRLIVSVVDGVVKRLEMVRTKGRALSRLGSIADSWGAIERLAVLHSGAVQDAAAIAGRMRDVGCNSLILAEVTPVIGAHIGPGCLGLAALLATV
jgi:DegV family protein with EDD domain